MTRRPMIIAVASAFLLTGLAEANGQQDRTRPSSGSQSRQSTGHSASHGSVKYHDSRSRTADRTSDRSSQRSPRSDRSTAQGTATPVRRTSNADVQRRSTRDDRSYRSTRNRDYAASGSVRHHRPSYERPTQLPARPPVHDVRVRRYPRYGTHITRLPAARREVVYRGNRYYFCDGVYYRPYGSGAYRVVRPPIGVQLPYLPHGYTVVFIGGRTYYRCENTYYVRELVHDEPAYVVVAPPPTVIIDVLPPDCHEVIYHDRLYYVDIYEEIAYAPVIVDGYTRYRPTNLDVDVDFDDGMVKIEIDD